MSLGSIEFTQKKNSLCRALPSRSKQTDLTKTIRGARKAGLDVKRVEIDRAGKIMIIIEKSALTENAAA
jgi:hypothetical protein